ncbi:hypothetical protein BYT27DRAFT_7225594 [Phlegmacium glaucopus]|nr:hypothetical protein BYT27DRAFT_7225594 [Phlegmacium glaucopus]
MDTYVPQELIDHVVDFAYNDRQTLCATRLVSRSWNISARVHFFRELDLLLPRTPACVGDPLKSQDRGVDKFTKLLDVLNTSPDMAYFVREIIIGNTTGLNPAQWNIYDRLLSDVVPQLKRVTTIYVREVDWSQISPSFINSVTELFESPHLQYLDMWNCQVPSMQVLVDFLNSSCVLAGLRLSHIRFSNNLDAAKALLPALSVTKKGLPLKWPRKPLQRLCIEAVPLSPMLYTLLTITPCSIDVTKLRSLFLEHIDDIPSVRHFLRVAGGSLESLEIWASACQSRCSAVQGTIDLSQTPRLKYLRVSGLQWTSGMCPAECLSPFFQNINSFHSLESLNIVITARKRKTDEFGFIQWSSLDEIISRPFFSALQKVQIMVYSSFTPFTPSDADRLTNAFPRLQANGKIHVMCM